MPRNRTSHTSSRACSERAGQVSPGFSGPLRSVSGFTLAELLIALTILGVIATFTIPKVLQGQQDTKFKSIAKEAAGTISGAYKAFQLENGLNEMARFGDMTQFVNYVRVHTNNEEIDHTPTNTNRFCTGSTPCLRLHNGAMLWYDSARFGGSQTTNAISFYLDPDGKYSGTATGPGKSVQFYLYYSGRLSSRAHILPNTCKSGPSCVNPDPNLEPGWFSWD